MKIHHRNQRSPAVSSSQIRPATHRRSDRRVSFRDEEMRRQRLVVKFPSPNLVMEEVKILKRGEVPPANQISSAVDRPSDGGAAFPFFSVERFGPDPEILPKHIGFSEAKQDRGSIAGPTYVTSPAPSSLRGSKETFASPAYVTSPAPSSLRGSKETFAGPAHVTSRAPSSLRRSKEIFAGPAYVTSPAPSSLPFPTSFLRRGLIESCNDKFPIVPRL